MKNKILLLATVFMVALPIRGCKKEVISPSIVEFDCRKNPIENLVPGTPNIVLVATRCEDYTFKNEEFSRAIFIFAEEYGRIFNIHPSEVLRNLSGLKVQVSLIPRVVSAAYDINGKFLQKQVPVNGLALNKDTIWVEIKTNKIHHTALAHELVHILIWRKNIVHGDPDHEGKKFSGWTPDHTRVIKLVNNKLLDLDI